MQSYEEISEKICQSRCDITRPMGLLTKAANPCFCTILTSTYFFFILELLALKTNGDQAVLDPEPSLLDSNFVEPSKLQLLFRPSGKYAASTHFTHIRVLFNFYILLISSSTNTTDTSNGGLSPFAHKLKRLQTSADRASLIKLMILWISWMLSHSTLSSLATNTFWTVWH
jgi:hypothetical protein